MNKQVESQNTEKIAVILVRGTINLSAAQEDTLRMLNLTSKNYCVVVKNTLPTMGMIKKVSNFVTFGPIDDETYNMLFEKRGEEYKGRLEDSKGMIKYTSRYVEHNGKKYKPYFRLSPPKKGYGRSGIKKQFTIGGALGDRKEKINDLVRRML